MGARRLVTFGMCTALGVALLGTAAVPARAEAPAPATPVLSAFDAVPNPFNCLLSTGSALFCLGL
ncbi:hypothetical protein NDR87_20825 [Nocardia sp. CDC159]|uniref:Uncharacterized protein n=1 Tax=Nocardia pulmonis TaxID=2951408 RepID=A0A9X2E9W6_9NOCA|nr:MULTISPECIES: hypothetical protein [Nocardia]MCM6776391.1 hypothetical protein [Nocardia pulmonis]MCM6788815.1 hypothetical protein [Nocardia sp. CDC159]